MVDALGCPADLTVYSHYSTVGSGNFTHSLWTTPDIEPTLFLRHSSFLIKVRQEV